MATHADGIDGQRKHMSDSDENVLLGATWIITVPYVDDYIAFSKMPEEHIRRLQQVIQIKCPAIPKTNPTRSAFLEKKV